MRAPAGRGPGRGRGGWWCGLGGGRGWRNMFQAKGLPGWFRFGQHGAPVATAAPEPLPANAHQMQSLQRQIAALQAELAAMQERLREIDRGDAAP